MERCQRSYWYSHRLCSPAFPSSDVAATESVRRGIRAVRGNPGGTERAFAETAGFGVLREEDTVLAGVLVLCILVIIFNTFSVSLHRQP